MLAKAAGLTAREFQIFSVSMKPLQPGQQKYPPPCPTPPSVTLSMPERVQSQPVSLASLLRVPTNMMLTALFPPQPAPDVHTGPLRIGLSPSTCVTQAIELCGFARRNCSLIQPLDLGCSARCAATRPTHRAGSLCVNRGQAGGERYVNSPAKGRGWSNRELPGLFFNISV